MSRDTKRNEQEIKGMITVTLANQQTLDDLCVQCIADYNRDRFEAFAVRLFLGEETIFTIYAVDKIRQEDASLKEGKLPVKKFKLTDIDLSELLTYCSAFNCTLNTGNYDIDDMEVVNK